MSDYDVSGLPSSGRLTINTLDSRFYYFPSGHNSSCNSLIITVTGSGSSINIGSPRHASVFDFPVTLDISLDTTVNLVGPVFFNYGLTVDFDVLPLHGLPRHLPLFNIGTGTNPVDANFYAPTGPLISFIRSGNIYFRNNASTVHMHLNPAANSGNGCVATYNNKFNVDPAVTNTLIYYVIDQEMIDNAEGALFPNSFWATGPAYNMVFTGTTGEGVINPWSLDPAYVPSVSMEVFIDNNITFDFTQYVYDENGDETISVGVMPQTMSVTVSGGYTLNLQNVSIEASPNDQAFKLYGPGTTHFNVDEDTGLPLVTLTADNSGYVYINNSGGSYGNITGHPSVYMTSGSYSTIGNNGLPYGIDPAHIFEQFVFGLTQSGTYVFSDFSVYPINLTIGASPITISGATFSQGMNIVFGASVDHSVTVVLNNTYVGGSTANINGPAPTDPDSNVYLIYSVDPEYSTLIVNPNSVLEITNCMNFILPSISVSGSGATYKIDAIPDYAGHYTFNTDIENSVVFSPTVVRLNTCGAYILDVDDSALKVKSYTTGTRIIDSEVHSSLSVDGTTYDVTTAGNTYYSPYETALVTPLLLSGTVTMSGSAPDTWYMGANNAYPYSGNYAVSSYQYGTIHLGNGGGGTYTMSNSSWYGMNAITMDDNGGTYILNDVSTSHNTNMQLTGNSGSSNVAIQSTAGVTLKAHSGYVYNINGSSIASGTQNGAIILAGTEGSVNLNSTASTLIAQGGKAIIYDTTSGAVTVSYSTDPTLLYQASSTAYNFGASNTVHTMEYDLGFKLYDPYNSCNFTFDGFAQAIKIVGDGAVASTPVIVDSSFAYGVELNTLASSQITVSCNTFYYPSSGIVILTSGAGTVYFTPMNNLRHNCNALDRFIQVGTTDGSDSCSLVSSDVLNIVNSENYTWNYGIKAYTTGTINAGAMTFPSGALHTNVRWYNLYTKTGQPFLSNCRYIAYSYDPSGTLGFQRYADHFELGGNTVTSYPFAICSGDPSLNGYNGAHKPQLTSTLRVTDSSLITSCDSSTLAASYNNWARSYYGSFDGSNTQVNTDLSYGHTLVSYNISLGSTSCYLGHLRVDLSFVELDFSNNGHNTYGVTPIAPFKYTITDNVSVPNMYVVDWNNPNNQYVALSNDNTAKITCSLSNTCVLPVYMIPYTDADDTVVTCSGLIYTGPTTTRNYIKHQSAADATVYLTYANYINPSINTTTIQSIAAGSGSTNFRITSVSGESYFTYGRLPFYGYFCRDPTKTSTNITSSTAGIPPAEYRNTLIINNDPFGQYPYPIVNDTSIGYGITQNEVIHPNEDGAEVGTFIKRSTYDDSRVHYSFRYWFKATLNTSGGIEDHIYDISADSSYFNYNFSTIDGSVTLVDNNNNTATAHIGGTDQRNHSIDVSITTKNNLSTYYFNSTVTPVIKMAETSVLTTLGTIIHTSDVSINTNFVLPPVVLVGYGNVADSAMASMNCSGNQTHSFNRADVPEQIITLKTVGNIASGKTLNYATGFSASTAAMNAAVDSNSTSQTITMTSANEHSTTYTYDVAQLGDTHKALNDGMTFTMTPDPANTTYNSITLNGNGSSQLAYRLITVSATEFSLATDEYRNIQFNYSVGPYMNAPDSSLNNYSDPNNAASWTIDNSVNIYPTSRIYDIGFTVSLNSLPYNVSDATSGTVSIDLSFNDNCGNGLIIGSNRFYVYSDNSLTTLSSNTLTLSSNWSDGVSFYIYAPDCSVGGVIPETIRVQYKVNATGTDYSGIGSAWHTLCVISYRDLPTGEIAAIRFNLGNWLIQSDPNGNLLFQYSVLRVDGTNDILGTYILAPLSTEKSISSVAYP